ncbi:MAG TPA: hypothetical protein VN258_11590 [Mobilitalea sp.]|nr:hypothetical protein [Mobilitalea sp.]
MIHITKVKPLEDYCLEVQLENGSSVILSLKSRLRTVRFGMLEDEAFYRRVTTDGNCIRWGNKLELSVSEIFQLVQKKE